MTLNISKFNENKFVDIFYYNLDIKYITAAKCIENGYGKNRFIHLPHNHLSKNRKKQGSVVLLPYYIRKQK